MSRARNALILLVEVMAVAWAFPLAIVLVGLPVAFIVRLILEIVRKFRGSSWCMP